MITWSIQRASLSLIRKIISYQFDSAHFTFIRNAFTHCQYNTLSSQSSWIDDEWVRFLIAKLHNFSAASRIISHSSKLYSPFCWLKRLTRASRSSIAKSMLMLLLRFIRRTLQCYELGPMNLAHLISLQVQLNNQELCLRVRREITACSEWSTRISIPQLEEIIVRLTVAFLWLELLWESGNSYWVFLSYMLLLQEKFKHQEKTLSKNSLQQLWDIRWAFRVIEFISILKRILRVFLHWFSPMIWGISMRTC